jgi:hypothetical protein
MKWVSPVLLRDRRRERLSVHVQNRKVARWTDDGDCNSGGTAGERTEPLPWLACGDAVRQLLVDCIQQVTLEAEAEAGREAAF